MSKILLVLSVPFIVVFALFSGVSATSDLGLLINDMFKKDRNVDINKFTR